MTIILISDGMFRNDSRVPRFNAMYVCICNAVTESQIRAAARSGTTDLWSLQTELGVAAGCGTCRDVASAILRDYRPDRHGHAVPRTGVPAAPVRYFPATG